VTPDGFKDFFIGLVGADGALIGLLFVAVSVAPRRLREPETAALAQAEATSALVVFGNVLMIGLFALLPGTDIGWLTVAVSAIAIVFGLALGRVAVAGWKRDRPASWALARIGIGIAVLGGFQLWGGVTIERFPDSGAGFHTLGITSAIGLFFGISRAWALVGLPGTSIWSSLRALVHPEGAMAARGPEDPAEHHEHDPQRPAPGAP
jgi:hypothetical protein